MNRESEILLLQNSVVTIGRKITPESMGVALQKERAHSVDSTDVGARPVLVQVQALSPNACVNLVNSLTS